MSDTTQYPDGPYLITWRNGDVDSIFDIRRGMAYGREGGYSTDWLLEQGGTLTPLVPSTELDAARQRIADLEAEVERLRAERTLDEMLQDLRRRYGSYVHLSANYNNHWWVAWGVFPQNRTGYYLVPSEAIRAAWEAVCKEKA